MVDKAEIVGKAAHLKRCRIVRRTSSSVQASTCFIMKQTHPLQVVIDLQGGMKELILQGFVCIWEAFNSLSYLCAKKKSLLTLLCLQS